MSDLGLRGEPTTGLPRPLARYDRHHPTKRLPLPWINTAVDKDGYADFYAFREDCSTAAEKRLCCICGDSLNRYVVLGAMAGADETSGGWGHPRCIQMAVRLCPHFAHHADQPIVAWLHDGPGVGVDRPTFEVDQVVSTAQSMTRADLTDFAQRDPWGTGPDSSHPDRPAGAGAGGA